MNRALIFISSAYYTIEYYNEAGHAYELSERKSPQFYCTISTNPQTKEIKLLPNKEVFTDGTTSFADFVHMGGNLIDASKEIVESFFEVAPKLYKADEVYILYQTPYYNLYKQREPLITQFEKKLGKKFKGMYSNSLLTDSYILASSQTLEKTLVLYYEGQLSVADYKTGILRHASNIISPVEKMKFFNLFVEENNLEEYFEKSNPALRKMFDNLCNSYLMEKGETYSFILQDRKVEVGIKQAKEMYEVFFNRIKDILPNYSSATGYYYRDNSRIVSENLYEIFKEKGYNVYLGKEFLSKKFLYEYLAYVALLNEDSNIRFNVRKNLNIVSNDGQYVYLVKRKDILGAKQDKYRKMQDEFFKKVYMFK